jgi:hypothetical protein
MKTFFEYLERRDDYLWLSDYESISEMSITELETRKPKDGNWLSPSQYQFNVEGDNCGNEFCYDVFFGGDSLKTTISFKRASKYKDERLGFGNQVFNGVQYAMMEFIQKNNPYYLTWEPIITRTVNPVTGKVTNPEGRKSVYEIFAIKSLFPLYVSVKLNEWIRKDIYDKQYVAKGFPSIPENLTTESSPLEKKKFLQNIRDVNEKFPQNSEEALSNQHREHEQEQEIQRREDGERWRRQQEERDRLRERISFHRGMDTRREIQIRNQEISKISFLMRAGEFKVGDIVYTNLTPETVNRSYGKEIYNDPNSLNELQAAMQEYNTNVLKIKSFLAKGNQNYQQEDNRKASYAQVSLVDSRGVSIMDMFFHLKDLTKNQSSSTFFPFKK